MPVVMQALECTTSVGGTVHFTEVAYARFALETNSGVAYSVALWDEDAGAGLSTWYYQINLAARANIGIIASGLGRIEVVENGADIDWEVFVLGVSRASGTIVGGNASTWGRTRQETRYQGNPPGIGGGFARILTTEIYYGIGSTTYPWDNASELDVWTIVNPPLITGGYFTHPVQGLPPFDVIGRAYTDQGLPPPVDGYLQTDIGGGAWRIDEYAEGAVPHRLTLASKTDYEQLTTNAFEGVAVRRPCIAGREDGSLLASATVISSGETVYKVSRDRGATWSAV